MVMRQADGTELLGTNDPRNASIGIIYVSPNDDRQSVLTAILIQDKLGRDQVIVVLPEENRAFQRPVDFDGLKNMRRGLQAQIIFVAPRGPGPAEFARQRRFPVYSSLENYAEALQGESSVQEDVKRGWLFGRREKSQKAGPDTPVPLPTDTTEDEQTQSLPATPTPPSGQIPAETESAAGDQDDQPGPPDTIDEEEEQEFPSVAPTAQEDDLIPVQEDEEPQPGASPDIASDPDSGIITFYQPQSEAPSNVPAPIVPPSIVPAYPVGRGTFPYARGSNRRPWLISVAVLLLLLAGGYIVFRIFFGTPLSATVTITPGSKDVKNVYIVSAVIGNPDPSRRQVQARLLFSSTPPQSKTVNATGTGSIPATQATGVLVFYNSSTFVQSVAADTVFVGTDGVEVVNDESANIPAASPPVEGFVTVTAHAVRSGAGGNISALDINGPCCLSGITVRNVIAFSGGQDAQSYTYVQQGDIDSAANTLESSLTQNAQASLQKQIHASEQLAGSPQCLSNVTSNYAASDHVANVTVSVSVTCLGEVYDYQSAVSMTEDLLKGEASNSLGAGYSLVGNVVATVTQATVEKNETVSLVFNAEGIWVYQFSNAQKKALANLIAGKSQQDAKALLQKQTGVNKVNIQLSQNGGDTLPTDPGQITIVTQSVPGVQGTTHPGGGAGNSNSNLDIDSPVGRQLAKA